MSILEGNKSGQLMVEAMVAISLLSIGMLGTFGVLSQSLGISRIAADQYVAANLASEGIEIVKNEIDAEYTTSGTFATNIFSKNNKFCPVDYKSGIQSGCRNAEPTNLKSNNIDQFRVKQDGYGVYGSTGDPTSFVRYVHIEWIEPHIIEVKSTVKWIGRGGLDFDIEVADKFYNWRSLPE
ncbi:MAG: hypothetical protein COT89_01470 [Candidatus Colwellbacteria bacterium CG10_big_fil_rev_8_21_14_0_10_42_22]|uniref:Type IV pilus modification protein PilV n=1 Tax=Candidatus Colwellbacteria bacterium CG10_big_fil_rev_8_21_14_0_10_42_22 TaxID=1974540 RepID=A0A2H0VIA4_9BACT|nr:MAG: hypothetical protein COT89_01470 [Candidatus Colwellbacteria bacterium CG10_big_fil_rev_8_21_14_0_10_42_22]